MNESYTRLFEDYAKFHAGVENTPILMDGKPHEWQRAFHGAVGLAGEASEVLELFKKELYGKNKPVDNERLLDELGDVWWYFWLLLKATDNSLFDVVNNNMVKLVKRYGK